MELSDSEFSIKFKNCSLDPSTFDHEAHLRLVWLQIEENGFQQAQINIQNLIQNFVKHVGAEEKYHKTLTITAIEIVNHFMSKKASKTFKEFISEFPKLKNNFKELIEQHYSYDIFQSAKAKNEYLEPDLIPFK